MKNLYFTYFLSVLFINIFGQKYDTIKNITKYKFLGNSWTVGLGYNLSKSHGFSINIGRTNKTEISYRNAQEYKLRFVGWGVGHCFYFKDKTNGHLLSAYGEFSTFYLPPVTTRLEYLYDTRTNSHYIRPSVGLFVYALEILYNYSFQLSSQPNQFKHGITFKIKIFTNSNTWQEYHKNQYYKKEKLVK